MEPIAAGHALAFPRDHGAHLGARIEWWYATGWLQAPGGGLFGFQLTFFRSLLSRAEGPAIAAGAASKPGRFEPRHLLFAHAALTDVAGQRHRHAQRMSRWSGDESGVEAHASRRDTDLGLGPWTLKREPARISGVHPASPTSPASSASPGSADGPAGASYQARLAAPEAGFTLDLTLQTRQPLLLQGDAGYSRKGAAPGQASHYYSQPQLAASGQVTLDGKRSPSPWTGQAWLDHEWSDQLLGADSTGWDWIGINLHDGSALTAFVLRNAAGAPVWAGGSHRTAGGALRDFAPNQVLFEPLREWRSPATGGRYPVQWRITTPAGRFTRRALLDAQELDSRASAGPVYWEGLAELLGPADDRRGLGYLEMTGRAQALKTGG